VIVTTATLHCPADSSHGAMRFQFEKNGASVYRCARCGTFSADAAYDPSQYDLDNYYTARGDTAEILLAYFGDRWSYVARRLAGVIPPPATLLDVGAGSGGFVRVCRRAGYAATGVDPSEQAVAFAREKMDVEIERGTAADYSGRSFDAVVAMNVIEHVPDPGGFLAEIIACARPAGIVAVTTPNTRAYRRLLRGPARWDGIDPPHHLHVLSRRGLDCLFIGQGIRPLFVDSVSTTLSPLRQLGPIERIARPVLFHGLRLAGIGSDLLFVGRVDP